GADFGGGEPVEPDNAGAGYDYLPKHQILYSAGPTAESQVVELITPDGNNRVTVVSEEAPRATEARWSPSLNKVVYQRWTGDSYDLVVQDVSGVSLGDTIQLVTDTPGVNETEPVWGDGYFYYVSDQAGGTTINRINMAGEPESAVSLTPPQLEARNPDQRVMSGAPGHSTPLVF